MTIDQQTGLYGMYDFVYTPWWQKAEYYIPALLIAVLLLIIFSYFFYKVTVKITDYYTPELTKAKKAIKRLEKKNFTDPTQLAQELQTIIKRYIANTYSISTNHFTTQECSLFLQHKVEHQLDKKAIQDLFNTIESILFMRKEIGKPEIIAQTMAVLDIAGRERKITNVQKNR